MRNVWKGLIVGGLTGAMAGVILDSLAGASKKAAALGDQVLEHAPDAGLWVQSVSDKAGEWLHHTDMPDQVRAIAQKLKDSDGAHRVKELGRDVASTARETRTAHSG